DHPGARPTAASSERRGRHRSEPNWGTRRARCGHVIPYKNSGDEISGDNAVAQGDGLSVSALIATRTCVGLVVAAFGPISRVESFGERPRAESRNNVHAPLRIAGELGDSLPRFGVPRPYDV